MVTIAPVHDHTRRRECEYTNQTHVIVQFSILNCSVSYYRHGTQNLVVSRSQEALVHFS